MLSLITKLIIIFVFLIASVFSTLNSIEIELIDINSELSNFHEINTKDPIIFRNIIYDYVASMHKNNSIIGIGIYGCNEYNNKNKKLSKSYKYAKEYALQDLIYQIENELKFYYLVNGKKKINELIMASAKKLNICKDDFTIIAKWKEQKRYYTFIIYSYPRYELQKLIIY